MDRAAPGPAGSDGNRGGPNRGHDYQNRVGTGHRGGQNRGGACHRGGPNRGHYYQNRQGTGHRGGQNRGGADHRRSQNRGDNFQNREGAGHNGGQDTGGSAQRAGHNRGEHKDSDRHQEKKKHTKHIGFKYLSEIVESSGTDILLKVCKDSTPFMELLNSRLGSNDMFVLIIKALAKLTASSFDQLKLKFLLEVLDTSFITNIRIYLFDLPYVVNQAVAKNKNALYWNNPLDFWESFIIFCDQIVKLSPSMARKKCSHLIVETTESCLEGLKNRHNFSIPEELQNKLLQLKLLIYPPDAVELDPQNPVDSKDVKNETEQPPENFRDLKILPTVEDLLGNKLFLRPNLINGKYDDVEHYLDVQFRLLREDYIGPLRKGINQYLDNPARKHLDNIRLHENCTFEGTYASQNQTGLVVQFPNVNRRIKWEYSKRFIHGSLLLLTRDKFVNFIAATVLDRNVQMLQQGQIPVKILSGGGSGGGTMMQLCNGAKYTMVESEVYFEPYYHVLNVLKSPEFPETMAMTKYIVDLDPTPKAPQYLQDNLDIKYVLDGPNGPLKVTVADPATWPTADDIGLNKTQFDAYQFALTQEFAVVQGPPGTGKTYLALRVTETLLKNVSNVRIMLICYTNHALDQFLEGILNTTESIARVGGQSRNEAMKKYNINVLRKDSGYSDNVLYNRCRHECRACLNELMNAQKNLNRVFNGVIKYTDVTRQVDEAKALESRYDRSRDPLLCWLFEHLETAAPVAEVSYEDLEDEFATAVAKDEVREMDVDIDDYDAEQVTINLLNITSFSVEDLEENAVNIVREIKNLSKKKCENNLLLIENQRKIVNLRNQLSEAKKQIDYFKKMSRYRNVRAPVARKRDPRQYTDVERWTLYFQWTRDIVGTFIRKYDQAKRQHDDAVQHYEEARMAKDLLILRSKKVVGMTTTGAARLRKLVQELAPTVVIAEEAAEVLETHIVSSLNKKCQHLILIGDHQQLRPSAAHYKLAKEYNLEVSLFERMISNGIHSRQLGVQHRMRPEIAALVAPNIYPDLRNHASVQAFPNVRGIHDNLFFFSHDYQEKADNESASKSNPSEGDMVLGLANYLMQQGYEATDVTILAAYSGQMFYMKKQKNLYRHLDKVKITVVDNYQGEESKIILLSLVRNNNDNKIGFLSTDNRVCVALSRAREGFYIFGNMGILTRNSDLWKEVSKTLESDGSLGTCLRLKCVTHNERTEVKVAADFDKCPEGGCMRRCLQTLSCGHPCQLICHGYDRGHVQTKCLAKCERILCDLQHICPKLCKDTCDPCQVMVKKTLGCKHEKVLACHRDPAEESVKCLVKVEVKLPACGHNAMKECNMPLNRAKCPVPCMWRVDSCGHLCRLTCHVNDDPEHVKYVCEQQCARAKRECRAELFGDRGAHQCRRLCHEPCDRCTVMVEKKRTSCNHKEKVECWVDINTIKCKKNCARLLPCGHHCKKKCHEPCDPTACKDSITLVLEGCGHSARVVCGWRGDAARLAAACTERCGRVLACGHACAARCGLPCTERRCAEPAPPRPAPCGHTVQLPCHLDQQRQASGDGGEWERVLLQYCGAACDMTLRCGHACGGSCGVCRQGRLHAPCRQPCGKTNICGHLCKEPCNQVCPPCGQACDVQCEHAKCAKTCGEPCTDCVEACRRGCVHARCSRRCGEPCSVAACREPCSARLRCGHACRGLCSDPCPDICNICRPDTFPTGFIGEEYDDDDKFVMLVDCGHVLEVESMDSLMQADCETVSIRQCPYCRTPVVNTPRYRDLIRQTFKAEINPIKEKVFGNKRSIEEKIKEINEKITHVREKYEQNLQESFLKTSSIVSSIHGLLKLSKSSKSLIQLDMYLMCLEIFDIILECHSKIDDTIPKTSYTEKISKEYEKQLRILIVALHERTFFQLLKLSEQSQEDLKLEIKRLNGMRQLWVLCGNWNIGSVSAALSEAEAAVLSPFRLEVGRAEAALQRLQTALRAAGIVTREERELIVRAMGSKMGHWYKCPNGHPYYIGECGGAMQISKCNECGVNIGGTHHTLLPGNAHAGDIDGSSHPAWSDHYDDMRNFQL